MHADLKLKGPVIEKTTLNAFESSDLNDQLKKLNISEVVICGMQSDYCVEANSLGAKALGYSVTTIKDAHSTSDSPSQKAPQIIEEINAKLSEKSVRLITTQDWVRV